MHVDAEVLADDTAAGRAHFEGGPSITGAQARRMLCEATAVVMLEKGREPLAVGRRRRRATKPQRKGTAAPRRRSARPGCPETRIERLHAHHMRRTGCSAGAPSWPTSSCSATPTMASSTTTASS